MEDYETIGLYIIILSGVVILRVCSFLLDGHFKTFCGKNNSLWGHFGYRSCFAYIDGPFASLLRIYISPCGSYDLNVVVLKHFMIIVYLCERMVAL